jgi:Fic family protein
MPLSFHKRSAYVRTLRPGGHPPDRHATPRPLSSQIEGAQSSLDDLLGFEGAAAVGAPREIAADRAGTMLRIHDLFQETPYATQKAISARTGLSHPTVNSCLGHMQGLAIIQEITGRKRERVYAYRRYLDILSEGAEPLPRP